GSERVLRRLRGPVALIPVHLVSLAGDAVLQVQPVVSATQTHIQTRNRVLVHLVVVGVGAQHYVVQSSRGSVAVHRADVFRRGDGPVHGDRSVTRMGPGVEVEAGNGGAVWHGKAVTDNVAKIEGPGVDCAVQAAVTVECVLAAS